MIIPPVTEEGRAPGQKAGVALQGHMGKVRIATMGLRRSVHGAASRDKGCGFQWFRFHGLSGCWVSVKNVASCGGAQEPAFSISFWVDKLLGGEKLSGWRVSAGQSLGQLPLPRQCRGLGSQDTGYASHGPNINGLEGII